MSVEGKAMVLEKWSACNKSMMADYFHTMVPEGYDFLEPKMRNVVNVIEDFITNYELPGCDGKFFEMALAEQTEYIDIIIFNALKFSVLVLEKNPDISMNHRYF